MKNILITIALLLCSACASNNTMNSVNKLKAENTKRSLANFENYVFIESESSLKETTEYRALVTSIEALALTYMNYYDQRKRPVSSMFSFKTNSVEKQIFESGKNLCSNNIFVTREDQRILASKALNLSSSKTSTREIIDYKKSICIRNFLIALDDAAQGTVLTSLMKSYPKDYIKAYIKRLSNSIGYLESGRRISALTKLLGPVVLGAGTTGGITLLGSIAIATTATKATVVLTTTIYGVFFGAKLGVGLSSVGNLVHLAYKNVSSKFGKNHKRSQLLLEILEKEK